jgi:ribosomal protein L7/L12
MTSVPTERLLAEIRRHLAAGNKIEAIKHYREATGVGLAEAKGAVERIEAGKAPLASPADAALPGAEASRIKAMIARGETMAAIKFYRKAAGVDLKAAKEAVDALAAQQRATGGAHGAPAVERQRGFGARGIAILLLLIVAAVALVWLLRS